MHRDDEGPLHEGARHQRAESERQREVQVHEVRFGHEAAQGPQRADDIHAGDDTPLPERDVVDAGGVLFPDGRRRVPEALNGEILVLFTRRGVVEPAREDDVRDVRRESPRDGPQHHLSASLPRPEGGIDRQQSDGPSQRALSHVAIICRFGIPGERHAGPRSASRTVRSPARASACNSSSVFLAQEVFQALHLVWLAVRKDLRRFPEYGGADGWMIPIGDDP